MGDGDSEDELETPQFKEETQRTDWWEGSVFSLRKPRLVSVLRRESAVLQETGLPEGRGRDQAGFRSL